MVQRWFQENGLLLNSDKSEAILLGTGQRLASIELRSVDIAGAQIELSANIKSLGVTIDSKLSFDQHVRNICKSSYSNIRALRYIRSSLTRDTAASIASAIVSTRLDYCNSLLYGTTSKNIVKLQRIQNSLARVVSGKRKFDHIAPTLKDLHWLPIRERITYKVGCLTFKAKCIGQPPYLADKLHMRVNSRSLRSSDYDVLAIPFAGSNIASRAFSVAGPRVWNNLPITVRNSCSISLFRKNLKTYLFGHAWE